MLSSTDISRIVSRIVEGYRPLVVGTFGSYAIGRPHEGSDLDLFIIKQTAHGTLERRLVVRRLLVDFLHPLDIHVFTPAEFEESAGEAHSFVRTIVEQACIYHWASESAGVVPSLERIQCINGTRSR